MAIMDRTSSVPVRATRTRRLFRFAWVALGLSGVVGLAAYIRYLPDRRSRICRDNLTRLDGAKEQWALEHDVDFSLDPERRPEPTFADLYAMDGSKYLKELPVCPSGGSYRLGVAGLDPTCSSGLPGHTIEDFCEVCAAVFAAEAAGLPPPSHSH